MAATTIESILASNLSAEDKAKVLEGMMGAPAPAKSWTQSIQEGIVTTQAGLDVATETLNGVTACVDAGQSLAFKFQTILNPAVGNAIRSHRHLASATANLQTLGLDQEIGRLELAKQHAVQKAKLAASTPDHVIAQQLSMLGSGAAAVSEPEEKMSTGTKVLVGTLVGMGGMALGFGIAYAVGGKSDDSAAFDNNVVSMDAAAGY